MYKRQDVSADTYGMEVVWGCIGFAVLVIWRHKENLKRLLSGLEPSIKKRNKS